jgi:hypothetical protein
MHVIRQVIFFSLIISLIYLLKKSFWFWITVTLFSLIYINHQIDNKDESVFGNLITLSESQLQEHRTGEENIRVSEYRFYFTDYSKNIITKLLGNGVYHTESEFGRRELYLNKVKKYYQSDVGYAAIYAKLGAIGLVLYFAIFYKVLKQKVSKEFMYAKLFLIYMIFANIAASWIFHDTIIICICLYILESCYKKSISNEIFYRNPCI